MREFLDVAFGTLELDWKQYVEIDPRYFRPTEVDLLLGDAEQGDARAGLEAEGQLPRADQDDGTRRRRGRPTRTFGPGAERLTSVAVVLGARGLLGTALGERLPAAGWRVAAAVGHAECDITDAGAVRALLEATRPDVVFNAAAYTDVDRAESEPAAAEAINAAGAENVARAAAAAGAAVVHYSTDFVFDGELERPYDESDPPSPQGRYAASKVAGDARVAAAAERHFILRVGCLYGRGGRNFPSTIVRRLRAGETIRAHNDRLGSPTWAREVADVSAALARTRTTASTTAPRRARPRGPTSLAWPRKCWACRPTA